jgi:F-type H+-transporting ATPase subunit delta
MMHSASRTAAEQVRGHKRAVIDRAESADALRTVAADLYAIADTLVDLPRVRRSLGDPATNADRRAELLTSLFGGKVGGPALEISQAVVRERWSSPWDMCDALEVGGDDALFAAAERDRVLEQVVDELFRFERILDRESALAVQLDEKPIAASRRIELLHRVVDGKVHPITGDLLEHAVRSQRKHTLAFAIDHLLEEAAARQSRSMARVLSAVELSSEQCEQLRGGLVVRIGDEVIDGSIAARLASAQLALAGHTTRQPIESRTRQGRH